MTSDESPSDPRVHCPKCGKRFRIPAAAVEDAVRGAPARCTGCGTAFRVRAGTGGAADVVREEGRTAGGSPPAADVPVDAAPDGAADGGSPVPGRAPTRHPRKAGRARPRERGAPVVETPIRPLPPPVFGVGERVARYEIEVELGRGGMGAVYGAFDPAANRHVAMKVLSAGAPEGDRARFQREVEVQGNIQHPHIMPIFDSGMIGRSRYFTMELLKDPLSLAELVDLARRGRSARDPMLRPVSTLEGLVRRILLPVCQAVYQANVREGVLHRDLKPENVLIDRNGLRPFVIDFGVCSLLERKNMRLGHLQPELPARLAGGGVRVTGTLLYMPPEQARGETDRRGDVWALGATLRFVASGSAPFAKASRSTISAGERAEGLKLLIEQADGAGNKREASEFRRKLAEVEAGTERSLEDLQRDVLGGRYVALPAGIPAALGAIIDRAMAVDPNDRYRHALELHDDLEAWLDGRAVKAVVDRRGLLGGSLYRSGLLLKRHRKAAALLVVALGVGAWAASGFLGRGAGSGEVDAAATRCLADAHAAVDRGEFSRATELAQSALAGNECAADAIRLLADLEGRERAQRLLADARTREQDALAAFEAGDVGVARLELRALHEILASGAVAPLKARYGSHAERTEVERLERLDRGQRTVTLAIPGGAAEVRAQRIASGGRANRAAGEGVALGDLVVPSLGYGRWRLVASRGQGEVWWSVMVTPGEEPLVLASPVDPGDVAAGRVYVPRGRVRGPLGDATVEAVQWDRTEVTGAQYAAWLATLPEEERRARAPRLPGLLGEEDRPLWSDEGQHVAAPADAAHRPVENVSVYDARAFAKAKGGRLPTAAEWAWAASGPDARLSPGAGLQALLEGGVRIAGAPGGAGDVATNAADVSGFGLRDMAGNVAEMTETLTTFRGTNGWLVMGGGYATSLGRAIVTEADPMPGWMPLSGVGFRLVYDLPKPSPSGD